MRILKNLSKFDKFLIFLALLIILYVFMENTFHFVGSKYNGNETELIGTVDDLKIVDNKMSVVLKAHEDVLLTYYFKEDTHIKSGDIIKVKGSLILPSKIQSLIYLIIEIIYSVKKYIIFLKLIKLLKLKTIKMYFMA